MRALRFGCRSRLSGHSLHLTASLTLSRLCMSEAAAGAAHHESTETDLSADLEAEMSQLQHQEHEHEEEGVPRATTGELRRPIAASILPYVYSPGNTLSPSAGAVLQLPHKSSSLHRIQAMMGVADTDAMLTALQQVDLSSETACCRYINLVAAYLRREQEKENSSTRSMKVRAARARADEQHCFLSPQEQLAMLTTASRLLEQRRVPLVVASRLLRFRWPTEVAQRSNPATQTYFTKLVRSWAAEALRDKTMEPRDARALLANCAVAFRQFYLRDPRRRSGAGHSRTAHEEREEDSEDTSPAAAARAELASLVGSLAAVAVQDITSPAQAEGLIGVMWSVHASGCTAPVSFWEDMVQRVLQLNSAFESQVLETDDREKESKKAPSSADSFFRRKAEVGHFFSTLTTRQLYRFLLVLKHVKWTGDPTVLHQVAEQTLRNVAFELESLQLDSNSAGSEGVEGAGEKENSTPSPPQPTSLSPPSSSTPPGPFTTTASADVTSGKAAPSTSPLHSRKEVARRIRLVADMRPSEFLQLLSLAADLRVPFGVSATRVSESLLTPLVPYLTTYELITLLRVVRHTRSQSTELLQAVMDALIRLGPTIPHALALSKTLVRAIVPATDVFALLEMDAFVHFFLDLCESQLTLCRAPEAVGMGEMLYTVGRRYEESSPTGLRIRAVVNLLCEHLDRLLQLDVIAPESVEPLVEATLLLRMREKQTDYPAVQDFLQTRAVLARQFAQLRDQRQEQRLARREAAVSESEGAAGLGPRWEDVEERDLPSVTKSARRVYREVTYMFERMAVVRARLSAADFRIFERDIERAGLFSLLKGVELFHLGHLDAQVRYTTASAAAAAAQIPRVFPEWMEHKMSRVVVRRLQHSRLSESSSDNDVLKVLGHVHCDAAKVDAVIALIVQSPLHKLKRQRALWLYVRELARRFGSAQTQKAVETHLSKSLYSP